MKDRFIPGRRWTAAEVATLRTMCAECCYASNAAEELGRDVTSVRVKAQELGLTFKKRFELYDDGLVERIKFLARCGYNSVAIGKTINRTPQSVRVKCAELGIKLKKPSAKNVLHVSMDRDTRERLQADATECGMTANELLRLLIAQIVSDQLYNAVIELAARAAAGNVRFWG